MCIFNKNSRIYINIEILLVQHNAEGKMANFVCFYGIICRLLHCSYHCLQVLSGRVLLFMTQNEDVQNELLQEQQLRILAATLDLTHDPVSAHFSSVILLLFLEDATLMIYKRE